MGPGVLIYSAQLSAADGRLTPPPRSLTFDGQKGIHVDSGPQKVIFRFVSGGLCLLTLPFGILMLFERVYRGPFVFDSTCKAGIAGLLWGIVMLVMVIRGR